jgi:hypothetical protein
MQTDMIVKSKVRMKNPMLAFLIPLFIIVLFPTDASAGWLLYHKPEFNGRVIDAETKEPIRGAVVVAAYYKTTMGVPHRYTDIIHFQEALTNKNGEFHIPSYTTIIQPLSWANKVTFIIYKSGYGNFPEQQIIPSGLKLIDEEIFFSGDIGGLKRLEMWVSDEHGLVLKEISMTLGIVELPRLSSQGDRIKAMLAGRPGILTSSDAPLYYKAINEERSRLGLSGLEE